MAEPLEEPNVTVEDALIGLTLTQAFFADDAASEDIFDQIIGTYDDDDLLTIYAQLTIRWAITEAAERGIPVDEYIKKLRTRMISTDSLLKPYLG